jgi:hypothetical protein
MPPPKKWEASMSDVQLSELTPPQVLLDMPFDPDRPIDGHFLDLNYVPWYARLPFVGRIQYLDWAIALRSAEDKAWREEYAKIHNESGPKGFKLSRFVMGDTSRKLHELETWRRVELEDRDPLNTMRIGRGTEFTLIELPWRSPAALRRAHRDSPRWKCRTRIRKMVSVGWRCEAPGCVEHADECHHLHYDTLGLEENSDLEALCWRHHRARHPGWH